MALIEFSLQYVPQKSVKGQALTDFLAVYPPLELGEPGVSEGVNTIAQSPWKLFFEGSRTSASTGAGIVLLSPTNIEIHLTFQLCFPCTNNQAEYEALIISLKMLSAMRVWNVEIISNSQLVIRHLAKEYRCESQTLLPYFSLAQQCLSKFDDTSVKHIPRAENSVANGLAQAASSILFSKGEVEKVFIIQRKTFSSVLEDEVFEIGYLDEVQPDWRSPIIHFLQNPDAKVDWKTRYRALNYLLLGEELFKRGQDDLLLKCLGLNESLLVMAKAHEGICGAHQARIKMRWLLRRHGYYWPTILQDCIRYAKGCQACQRHAPMQGVPVTQLHPIVKPWPLRGWALDLIGKVTPPLVQGHTFVIVATNYFIKWVEVVPIKSVSQADVIRFVKRDCYLAGLDVQSADYDGIGIEELEYVSEEHDDGCLCDACAYGH
ncbi:uncharacterized protein LOC122662949 [Telopea speciosissima]|uniref:uncharacterized protein LOC122662949 n=1 Tax=Telopea speciosissima TaxID=54955 RepID=UPI001CC5FD27|nr:uncharacterized protein LOC122662949 [Telopea speciosissima]